MMLNGFSDLLKKNLRIARTRFAIKYLAPKSSFPFLGGMLGMGLWPELDPFTVHFNRNGHFHREACLGTIAPEAVADIAEMAQIIEGVLGKNFISLYVRGSVAINRFTERFSDLDLVVITKDGYVGGNDFHLFMREKMNARYSRYSKVDIGLASQKDAETDDTKWNIILRTEGVCFAGKMLNVNAPVDIHNKTLWSLYSDEPFIVGDIFKFFMQDRRASRDIIKALIRAMFEKARKDKPAYYTKDLVMINALLGDAFCNLTGGWVVKWILSGLFRDFAILSTDYELDENDYRRAVINLYNGILFVEGKRDEEDFIFT